MKIPFSLFDTEKDKLAKDKKLTKEEYEDKAELKKMMVDFYTNHPLKGEEQTKRAYLKAFVDGYHYMTTPEKSNKLYDTKKPATKKNRSKLNYIRRNRNISVSKVLKDQPVLNALPMSGSMKDIKSARIARALFDNAFAKPEIDMVGKLYDVEKICYDMGTGWLKIPWNPLLKEGKGDYQITVHDDFEVYPDSAARDYFTQRHQEFAYLQDIIVLETLYPEYKGKIKEWKMDEDNDNRNLYVLDYFTAGANVYKGKAFVLEYWERPSKKYPKGKKAILVNLEYLVHDDVNPHHEYGEYSLPGVPFVWERVPGRIHGRSGVEDQISPQMEINKICSLNMENIRKTAAFKIFLPGSGSVKTQDLTSEAVTVHRYNPEGGGLPAFLAPPAMPSYIQSHLGFLIGAQADITSIHEVSQGQLPSNGSQMSGSALKLLQDSEMVSLSVVMRSLKASMQIVGQILLWHCKTKYLEKRMLSIVGAHKRHEVIEFKGADINGAVDIKCEIGSAINTSASAKIEATMNLWKLGIIQEAAKNNRAAKKVLESLEFGMTDDLYQMESLEEQKAKWILETYLREHTIVEPEPWEDHGIYIQILREFMLTPDYVNETNEVKQGLRNMMATREQLKAQKAPPPEQGEVKPMGVAQPTNVQDQNETNMMMAEGNGMGGGQGMEMQ